MPTVSIVMSVYNDEQRVTDSVNSILNQTFTDFEFIIINDGSTDSTGKILDHLADKDSRIRVIHQENTGLTQALIQGCAKAQGDFIARQDSGDISMPDRLEKQVNFLKLNPNVSLIACSASFISPDNEFIYSSKQSGDELEKGLVLDNKKIKGPPHHGSTMFTRDAYNRVGGYHSVFSVAQDIDLWLRLAEVGQCFCLPSVLYQARLDASGITSNYHKEQIIFRCLAIQCAINRRNNLDEKELLKTFKKPTFTKNIIQSIMKESNFYYFLGGCLKKKNPSAARIYFKRSYMSNFLNLKALLRIFTT